MNDLLPSLPYRSPDPDLGLYLCDLKTINPLNVFLDQWKQILSNPVDAVTLHLPKLFTAMLRTSIFLMDQMSTVNGLVNRRRHCSVSAIMSSDDLLVGSGMSHVQTQLNGDLGSSRHNGPTTSSTTLPSLLDTFDASEKENAINEERRRKWTDDINRRNEYLFSLPEGADTHRHLQFRTQSYLTEDQSAVRVETAQNIARYILGWTHWNYYLILHHLPMGIFYKECGRAFDRTPCHQELVTDENLCRRIWNRSNSEYEI